VQQKVLSPLLRTGLVTLVGAITESTSSTLALAQLSRVAAHVLAPWGDGDALRLLDRAQERAWVTCTWKRPRSSYLGRSRRRYGGQRAV
jgi:replication-associated recombination protein RarA